jgi:hypothetical protein
VPGQPENVSNGTGRLIGSVVEIAAGNGLRRHWRAIALDGTDLGAHARRVDAEGAVFDDWVDGCPREPQPARVLQGDARGRPEGEQPVPDAAARECVAAGRAVQQRSDVGGVEHRGDLERQDLGAVGAPVEPRKLR